MMRIISSKDQEVKVFIMPIMSLCLCLDMLNIFFCNYCYIKFCFADCRPQAGSQAMLTCENDTLTVTWSTDVTFDGSVTEIPNALKQRLTDRLIEWSRYPTLSMLVITRIPP